MQFVYICNLFLYIIVSFAYIGAQPLKGKFKIYEKKNKFIYLHFIELSREIRSPHILKKPFLGGLFGGGQSGYQQPHSVVNNHITNINNYGHDAQGGHGHGGGSFAGSAAFAGGHGHGQSQASSFAFGPFSAAVSQSQASGGKGSL